MGKRLAVAGTAIAIVALAVGAAGSQDSWSVPTSPLSAISQHVSLAKPEPLVRGRAMDDRPVGGW